MDAMHMPNRPMRTAPTLHRRRLRRIAWIATLVLAMASSASVVGWMAGRHALLGLSTQTGEQLQLRALALQRLIDRYRVLPTVLALDPQLRSALTGPVTATGTLKLNHKLEQANGATHVSTLTLIDRHGVAIAASNWREPSSNVGLNYAFRPYFQDAMHHGIGTFYAIGVSTNVAGYFIAKGIDDDAGRRIGVIVVKITLEALKQEWATDGDIALLSDSHGIVFLSNDKRWQYHPLHPLDAATAARIAATRQYGDQPLVPLRLHVEKRFDDGALLAHFRQPALRHDVLWRSLPLPAQGWTIHLLRDAGPASATAWRAALATLGAWLPLILLGLFLQQRMHLSRIRQRSREELEQLVAHYATALRSEQDSLVQAALQAASGKPHRLEQLPQGVSVVDRQLRLVAWNRRYADIFDYPPELLSAGRPVEELFRYNAQRGLLGPGNLEEAIQRRVDYLRRGGPHMYERERPDGSVLEIRGNPLPDGGFVTSYADITSYKRAARALRTLTGTLENRIEKSTRDLRQAKAEAERANRNKTRYVAAAVHDLLQPLNAARMFLGVLRGHLQAPPDQALAERVENALAAQDELLESLLDIARLEAGALPVDVQDLPLAPLLETIARQFGILAQSRGLDLHAVPCQAWVRSDPLLLRRILQNFLSNAIHYTTQGRVLLGCRRCGRSVRIEVWDTGRGIPEARQREIFEEFSRLDGARDPDDRSAGLGLSIVDRIARLLGHPVGLRSWPGRGSVFSVTVPLGEAVPATAVATEPPGECSSADSPLRGKQVWCIDDDADVREATRALLEDWGCRVVLANSGTAALALADGGVPALILLDHQLGDTTGSELWPALRGRLRGDIPVIVMTAQRDAETLARIEALGLRYLAKPLKPAALRALMSQLLLATAGDQAY